MYWGEFTENGNGKEVRPIKYREVTMVRWGDEEKE
jgi:hypothetical protein